MTSRYLVCALWLQTQKATKKQFLDGRSTAYARLDDNDEQFKRALHKPNTHLWEVRRVMLKVEQARGRDNVGVVREAVCENVEGPRAGGNGGRQASEGFPL